jgi:peptide/nickel transport system permease protein
LGSPSIPATGFFARALRRAQRQQSLRRFARHRLALGGGVVTLLVIACALFAPLIAHHSPTAVDIYQIGQGPGHGHLLGTDQSGRDVWSRLVYGSRTSLAVGFGAVTLYVLIGVILGTLAGYFGGWVDQVIMRVTDTVMSVPSLLLVIVFVSAVGPSLQSVLIVIGLFGWPGAARLVRGQILALKQSEFMVAARIVGANNLRMIVRHLLPNTLPPLIVLATFGVANAILLEASLSFLGLGIRPPASSWGGMLNAAQSPDVLLDMPWLWIPPAVAIAITVLSVNFVGDGLRDALDPRARQRW